MGRKHKETIFVLLDSTHLLLDLFVTDLNIINNSEIPFCQASQGNRIGLKNWIIQEIRVNLSQS